MVTTPIFLPKVARKAKIKSKPHITLVSHVQSIDKSPELSQSISAQLTQKWLSYGQKRMPKNGQTRHCWSITKPNINILN